MSVVMCVEMWGPDITLKSDHGMWYYFVIGGDFPSYHIGNQGLPIMEAESLSKPIAACHAYPSL